MLIGQDNGFTGFVLPLKGYILATETVEADNLFDFLNRPQMTDNFPHGIFNIDNPNGPKMSFESNTTKGLSIGSISEIIWQSKAKCYDFDYLLLFAGTFV